MDVATGVAAVVVELLVGAEVDVDTEEPSLALMIDLAASGSMFVFTGFPLLGAVEAAGPCRCAGGGEELPLTNGCCRSGPLSLLESRSL